jgi:hypothetical protein
MLEFALGERKIRQSRCIELNRGKLLYPEIKWQILGILNFKKFAQNRDKIAENVRTQNGRVSVHHKNENPHLFRVCALELGAFGPRYALNSMRHHV